jgi:hypothetical protein
MTTEEINFWANYNLPKKRKKKTLKTGVEITTDKNGKDKVFSPFLENNPLLNKKIGVVKFSSKHIPTNRLEINEWFNKFEK